MGDTNDKGSATVSTTTMQSVGDVSVSETVSTTPQNAFERFFTAAKAGAAYVYHDIVAIEPRVVKWKTDNAAVADLIQEGLALAETFLEAHGVPMPAIETAIAAVVSALHEMAASDATIKSGNVAAGV